MLKILRRFLEQPDTSRDSHSVALASAVLLAEVVRADHKIDDRERAAMATALNCLPLAVDEIEALIAEAETTASAANDLQQFTRVIHEHWSVDEKYQLLCNLWRVAYSSDGLDQYEEHIIRRISDLLYMGHGDFTRSRAQIRAERL